VIRQIVVEGSVRDTCCRVYKNEVASLDQRTGTERRPPGPTDGGADPRFRRHLRPVDVLSASDLTVQFQRTADSTANQCADDVKQITI